MPQPRLVAHSSRCLDRRVARPRPCAAGCVATRPIQQKLPYAIAPAAATISSPSSITEPAVGLHRQVELELASGATVRRTRASAARRRGRSSASVRCIRRAPSPTGPLSPSVTSRGARARYVPCGSPIERARPARVPARERCRLVAMGPNDGPTRPAAPERTGAPLDDVGLEAAFRTHRDGLFRYLLRRTRHRSARRGHHPAGLHGGGSRPSAGGRLRAAIARLAVHRRAASIPGRPAQACRIGASGGRARRLGRRAPVRARGRRGDPARDAADVARHRDVLVGRLLEGIAVRRARGALRRQRGGDEDALHARAAELQRELASLGVER